MISRAPDTTKGHVTARAGEVHVEVAQERALGANDGGIGEDAGFGWQIEGEAAVPTPVEDFAAKQAAPAEAAEVGPEFFGGEQAGVVLVDTVDTVAEEQGGHGMAVAHGAQIGIGSGS